jgi:hypothetical protein
LFGWVKHESLIRSKVPHGAGKVIEEIVFVGTIARGANK